MRTPVLVIALILPMTAGADFALNFKPNTDRTWINNGDPNGFVRGEGNYQSSCGIPGYDDVSCTWSKATLRGNTGQSTDVRIPDTTEFRQESVYISGEGFWLHVMVGDPSNSWEQDVYIRMSGRHYHNKGTLYWNSHPSSWADGGHVFGSLSDSGGIPGGFYDSGNQAWSTMDANELDGCAIYAGNACDPLGLANADNNGGTVGKTNHRDPRWTGNGSGNPTRVLIRQVDRSDPEMTQEFLKDRVDRKPLIYQEIDTTQNGDRLHSIFQADMRGKTYGDVSALTIGENAVTPNSHLAPINKTNGARINGYQYDPSSEFVLTQTLEGVGGAADYNAAEDGQRQFVSAGRFTFTPGGGWVASDGTWNNTYYKEFYDRDITGSNIWVTFTDAHWSKIPVYQPGTYDYVDGDYDHLAAEPHRYMNPAQNPCNSSPFC